MSAEPDDILGSATRALRDQTESPGSAARFTRLRVMASLRESEVRRRTQTLLLLPFAACLAVATAWGAAVGTVTEVREALVRALGVEPAPTAPPAPSEKPPRRRAPGPRSVPAPSVSAPAPAPPEPAPVLETPSPPEPPLPGPPAPNERGALQNTPPRRHAAPAKDPAHELYRAAHEAHFVAGDFSRALGAWDAYLQRAPRGRLAPEARYNRALCLVRLGRSDEARRALEGFASAPPGSYRQREAAALLEVLGEN